MWKHVRYCRGWQRKGPVMNMFWGWTKISGRVSRHSRGLQNCYGLYLHGRSIQNKFRLNGLSAYQRQCLYNLAFNTQFVPQSIKYCRRQLYLFLLPFQPKCLYFPRFKISFATPNTKHLSRHYLCSVLFLITVQSRPQCHYYLRFNIPFTPPTTHTVILQAPVVLCVLSY